MSFFKSFAKPYSSIPYASAAVKQQLSAVKREKVDTNVGNYETVVTSISEEIS
jgi:hypothetical protein